jgi:uncharacterized membrane protein (Fun14 family)
MTKKNLLVNAILIGVVFCGTVTLAQDPVQDVNKSVHPNLAQAQRRVVAASP